MDIDVKYLSDITPLRMIDGGDWIDLRAAQTMFIKEGEFKLVPLGVVIVLPEGYEALVVPRSSTFKNHGIIQTNSIGVIDESYCGENDEWKMPVFATRDTTIIKDERICQFRIIKHQPHIEFNVVKTTGNKDRNGFGSTGIDDFGKDKSND